MEEHDDFIKWLRKSGQDPKLERFLWSAWLARSAKKCCIQNPIDELRTALKACIESGLSEETMTEVLIESFEKEQVRRKLTDDEFLAEKGCDRATYKAILAITDSSGASPQQRYREQYKHQQQKGTEWKLNFYEWWKVWEESGKWHKRGKGQYVMGRKDVSGPYSVENVAIMTCAENVTNWFESNKD